MKFIIVGKGSIGKKHSSILENKGHEVLFVRSVGGKVLDNDIQEAIKFKPSGALICSPTSFHVEHAEKFLSNNIPTLIEKPISNSNLNLNKLKKYKNIITVGYNIHFHPGFRIVKNMLSEKRIGEIKNVKVHFGAYIPDWFKNKNLKETYACQYKLGGGVLLTSIHEINFSINLFGKVKKIFAIESPNKSYDVETCVEILFIHNDGIVSNISLDFFENPMRRYLKIVGQKGKILLDFNKCEISIWINKNKLKQNIRIVILNLLIIHMINKLIILLNLLITNTMTT